MICNPCRIKGASLLITLIAVHRQHEEYIHEDNDFVLCNPLIFGHAPKLRQRATYSENLKKGLLRGLKTQRNWVDIRRSLTSPLLMFRKSQSCRSSPDSWYGLPPHGLPLPSPQPALWGSAIMPALTDRDKIQFELESMMDVTELVIHECSRNMNGTGSSVTRSWRSRIGHDHQIANAPTGIL